MTRRPIVLVGGGGHAALVAGIVEALGGFLIVGYTAPVAGTATVSRSHEYLGEDCVLPALMEQGVNLAALGVGGTGDNRPRCDLYLRVEALGLKFPPLIHPAAVVAPDAVVDKGSVIAPGAVVNTGARVGINVVINTGAVVEHNCVIGDHAHIAPRALLCGEVTVRRLAHVGVGAVVIQGITVGEAP